MTTAKSTARTTATPISRSVVQEMVLTVPLTTGMDDVLAWVEDDIILDTVVLVVSDIVVGVVEVVEIA